ncbi:MAG: hypothetical protein IIC58_04425 [Proteobacteria bacterium]|nr:hypothetical protein [Pseudomonadota bacterium]
MNATDQIIFYSSKPRLLHMAANILIAPALLYLVGLWAWPPTMPHYVTFFITGLIAMRYVKQRWGSPRLVFDSGGFYCREYYPAESIQKVEPVLRSIRLSLLKDGESKDKVVSLGWASNDDFKTIINLAVDRFNIKE